jgi:hypothetical protein
MESMMELERICKAPLCDCVLEEHRPDTKRQSAIVMLLCPRCRSVFWRTDEDSDATPAPGRDGRDLLNPALLS